MYFTSDNAAPANKEVLEAIKKASSDFDLSYGQDNFSKKAKEKFNEIFEKNVNVLFVGTGSIANSLALQSICPAYSTILCHKNSHINTDECGAPEFFTGGSKLELMEGKNGKLDVSTLEKKLKQFIFTDVHHSSPKALSITNQTEAGTIYNEDETSQLCSVAKKYNISTHLDGARFANALIATKKTPAELTWKSGIDVMSFGGTKNGTVCTESVIFFNKKIGKKANFYQKKFGQLFSKQRFISAQYLAYFKNNLWLKNANSANKMAKYFYKELSKTHKYLFLFKVQGNEIFIKLNNKEVKISTKGRHDPCVGIRAVPVGEAMMAITLADHWLRYKVYKNS